MKSESKWRIRILFVFLLIFAGILVAKMYLVQVVHGQEFRDQADRQYTKISSPIYDRGSIFFKSVDGTLVSAATLQSGFTLAIVPKDMKDAESAYEKIGKIIPLDKNIFLARAAKPNDPYEEIATKLSQKAGLAIDDLNIPGVHVYTERWRYYPGDNTASHAIGFVGSNGNSLVGRYGLEKSYENVLARGANNLYINFFAEIFSDLGKTVDDQSSLEGDIVTTIEPTVQNYLEKELTGVQEKYQSEMSGGIIINPQTGEIYAMAIKPDFDPNTFNQQKSPAVFDDKLVDGLYEMGSILKPLTMAAGIDAGVVTASTTYNDLGFVKANGQTIWNYDLKGRGPGTTMQTVLNDSLNTGASFVVSKMGNDIFSNYFKNYGLGTTTGIDLPNEIHGNIRNLNAPRDLEHFTASFGQGISQSPIEITRALSVLANGGYLITPHVVSQIKYSLGFNKDISYPLGQQVIKTSSSQAITKMLVTVVDKALLGGTVMMPNYSIAAKTGTAQISDGKTGYYSDRYLHSFFGYFPAYNPKFLVFLYTVYPKGVAFASHTLTLPFIDISKFLINYYKVPPDR